jgi:hypothetical protein
MVWRDWRAGAAVMGEMRRMVGRTREKIVENMMTRW